MKLPQIKFYGYSPISKKKISGYICKIKNRSLYIFNGRHWRRVNCIYTEKI